MKWNIKEFSDLPDGRELFLGSAMNNHLFCNRYLRRGNIVEVQHIYRYGKDSKTKIMTKNEFNEWQEKARQA